MHTISLTRGFVATVDEEDYHRFKGFKWCLNGYGYATRNITLDEPGKNRKRKQQPFLLHRAILNAPKGTEVDHANGDKLDNRRHNLRLCNRAQNQYNQHKIRGLSKFKGVSKWKEGWRSMIQISPGQRKYLGAFKTEIEAAQAYDAAALTHHGAFAKTNKMLGRY